MDLRYATEALHCKHCPRKNVPDSKSKISIPKSDTPLACGMSVFAPPINPTEDISCMSNLNDAKLVLLVRRNHVSTVISNERHFKKHPKGYQYLDKIDPKKFYTDVVNAQKGYWNIMNASNMQNRPAMVIFYEQLVRDPAVLEHLQRFLGLAVHTLQSIEKKSSERPSIEWLGRYYEGVRKFFGHAASPLLNWMLNSIDFDNQYDIERHFREICATKPLDQRPNFFWMNVSCSDVNVIEGYRELKPTA